LDLRNHRGEGRSDVIMEEKKTRFYYGYVVTAAGFTIMLVGGGTYTPMGIIISLSGALLVGLLSPMVRAKGGLPYEIIEEVDSQEVSFICREAFRR